MKYLHGVSVKTLEGLKIVRVEHGAPDGLMLKINPYNAYTLTTESKTYVVWNSHGETNLSEVRE